MTKLNKSCFFTTNVMHHNMEGRMIMRSCKYLVQYYAAAAASMDERVHLKVMLVPMNVIRVSLTLSVLKRKSNEKRVQW